MNFLGKRLHAAKSLRVAARMLACCLLSAIPACAIPQLRQAECGAPLPAAFHNATGADSSATLGVDEFFGDPGLSRLIDEAMCGNRELKILNEEIQIAGNEILARQGAYLPFIGGEASSGYDTNSRFTPLGAAEREVEYRPGRRFPNPNANHKLGLNLFWQIDLWRELRNAGDAAAQRYVAAFERRNDFVTKLIADIGEQYYRLMSLDQRIETLDQTIKLQEDSLKVAKIKLEAGRGTVLAVQRFEAEVSKNRSEKLIVGQEIIEAENRINVQLNRLPQPVARSSGGFLELNLRAVSVGVPAQLLANRPDIRQAERELAAAGLDVLVARARFFPRLDITGGVGYEAFSPKYLFTTPEALAYSLVGNLAGPICNRLAIEAEYRSANARQLQAVYNYQRVVLNGFTEVVNRISMSRNYTASIEVKRKQLDSLTEAVDTASKLFNNARAEYSEVLFAQRDLQEARMTIIETKRQQLTAVVDAYQALGGGDPARFPDLLKRCAAGVPVPVVVGGKVADKEKPAEKSKDKDELKPEELPAPRPLELIKPTNKP